MEDRKVGKARLSVIYSIAKLSPSTRSSWAELYFQFHHCCAFFTEYYFLAAITMSVGRLVGWCVSNQRVSKFNVVATKV